MLFLILHLIEKTYQHVSFSVRLLLLNLAKEEILGKFKKNTVAEMHTQASSFLAGREMLFGNPKKKHTDGQMV